MITLAQATNLADALNAASVTYAGTADVTALPYAPRRALVAFQTKWLRANAATILPGWNVDPVEPAADALMRWLRFRSMDKRDMIVSFVRVMTDTLSPDKITANYTQRRKVCKGYGEGRTCQTFTRVSRDLRPLAFFNDPVNASLLARGLDYDFSRAEGATFECEKWGDALDIQVAMSYTDQRNMMVTPPPTWGIEGEYIYNLERNWLNFNYYCAEVNRQAQRMEKGEAITIQNPPYVSGYRDENFVSKYMAEIIGVISAVGVFAGAVPAFAADPVGYVTQSAASAVKEPLGTIKSVATDPLGAAQDAAHDYLVRQLAPFTDVVEIVIDPAGFVRDKFTSEILYPLQNPQEWVKDQVTGKIKNIITGEVRDAITGAIVKRVPLPTAAPASQNVQEIAYGTVTTAETAAVTEPTKKPSLPVIPVGLLLAVLLS